MKKAAARSLAVVRLLFRRRQTGPIVGILDDALLETSGVAEVFGDGALGVDRYKLIARDPLEGVVALAPSSQARGIAPGPCPGIRPARVQKKARPGA